MTDMVKNNIFGVWQTGMSQRLDHWLRFESKGLEECLSLYHNVLSTFVTPGDTRFPDLEVNPVRLDNLLCEGDKALLAIFEDYATEDQLNACKALGLASVTLSSDEDDDELCCEYMETYLNRYLDQVLGEGRSGGAPPRYAARILQREVEDAEGWAYVDEGQWVYNRTKELRMQVQVENGPHPWWYFTWYGAEMGLAGAMLPGHDMLSEVCAEAAWDRMWEVLDAHQEPEAEEALPLGTRLDRASKGEKAPRLMSRLVGDFGAMLLKQWMTDCSDGLAQLTNAGLTPESTYCAAAARIYEMLEDEKREAQGRLLLLALSAPHTKGGSPLYHESLACVLKGAALHTGQDYFNWRLKRIDAEWSAGPSYPYGVAVGFARDMLQKYLDNPNDPDAGCVDLYYQLLIQLTIEPFSCG